MGRVSLCYRPIPSVEQGIALCHAAFGLHPQLFFRTSEAVSRDVFAPLSKFLDEYLAEVGRMDRRVGKNSVEESNCALSSDWSGKIDVRTLVEEIVGPFRA